MQLICPLLEKLRIDRALFTLDGIRDFVQLRLVMGMPSSQHQRAAPLRDIQISLLYPRPSSDQVVDHENHEHDSGPGRLEIELCELGLRSKITFASAPPTFPANGGNVWEYVNTRPTDGLTIDDSGFGGRSVGW